MGKREGPVRRAHQAIMYLPAGKLPAEILEKLLDRYGLMDETVALGPSIGEDAAAIDFGGKYLLAKTDPVTFVSEDIGTYAVHVNANDIAVMGGVPRWFLATILLPEKTATAELAETIFRQIRDTCKKVGVSLCGGHTEITVGLDRPIVTGCMLGEVEKEALVRTSGARVGDDILCTKSIAIEGTSIVAREKEEELRGTFNDDFLRACRGLSEDPGISVVKEATLAVRSGEVHAMHDPTEGGLATGLHEIARAAGVGMIVYHDRIPLLPQCEQLSKHLGLDPLGLIASGSLLITLRAEDTEGVIRAIRKEGIEVQCIGRVLSREEGLNMVRQGRTESLPWFDRDEITKIFSPDVNSILSRERDNPQEPAG